tara:strand:- start:1370 stop:2332 length:963 start_codon:yes stop_codon:yes gene_type:complete
MSNTGYLINATTRHAIFVERYGHGRYNDLEPILNDMRDKIVKRLSKESNTDFQISRLFALLADIDEITGKSFGQFSLDLSNELADFSKYEGGFYTRMLGGTIKIDAIEPAVEQLAAAVTDSEMVLTSDSGAVQRLSISQSINQFDVKKSQEIRNLIQQGFIGGETTDEITRKVISQVNGRTKAQARALVSTTISTASNVAHNETAKANSDVLRGEQIIATLDSHTSDICISADKTIWPVGKGPHPPLHWNCRSLRVMLVDPKYAIPGLEGTRASETGQVSANLSYKGWLKLQPKAIREQVSIKKSYSLSELAALEPVTFL